MATASSMLPALGDYGHVAIDQSYERTRIWNTKTGEPLATLFFSKENNAWLSVSPEGHYTGSEGIDKELLYVVELDDGTRLTLPPADFSRRFNWHNNPKLAISSLCDLAKHDR
jgi:hypothetical protein